MLEQIGRAQQAREDFDHQVWGKSLADVASLRRELNAYVRELHKRGRNGWTPFRAMGTVLRAEGSGIPEIDFRWPDAEIHDVGDYQRLVELVEDAGAVLTRVGDITAAAALSGIEVSEWSPPWESWLLGASRILSAALKSLARAATAVSQKLGLAEADLSRPRLAALKSLAEIVLDPLAPELVWALNDGADEAIEEIRAHSDRASRYKEIKSALAAAWSAETMSLPLTELEAQWKAAQGRALLPRTIAQRSIRSRLANAIRGKLPEDLAGELRRLVELQALERSIDDANGRMSAVVGSRWRGINTDFQRIKAQYGWAKRLRVATAACARDSSGLVSLRQGLRQLLREGADLLAPEAAIGSDLRGFEKVWLEVENATSSLASLSGTDPAAIVDTSRVDWAEALAAHLDGWRTAARHLRDWCAWRGVVQRAEDLGIGDLVRSMESGLIAPTDVLRVFQANYARWWIGLAVDASSQLKSFVAARHEKRIERFRELDAELLHLAARVVRAAVTAGIPDKAQRDRDPEYMVLTRELAKRQQHLPMRQLAQRMPTALRRLTPCFMIEPVVGRPVPTG